MADRVFLSLWFANESGSMASRLARVLAAFPASAQLPNVRTVAVTPLDWSQPRILEERIEVESNEPAEAAATLQRIADRLREHEHPDYAFEVVMNWDVFEPGGEQWRLSAMPVQFTAVGPEFAEAIARESGEIVIDLGLDDIFLGQTPTDAQRNRRALQSNIAKLLRFHSAVEKTVQPSRRLLWSEADENLAAKLESRLQPEHGGVH
jgi:hypothetical protein